MLRFCAVVLCSFLLTSAHFLGEPNLKNVICPDDKSECADGNTCCISASNHYMCCPVPNANCCSDRVHCCPDGYKCSDNGQCTKSNSNLAHPLIKLTSNPIKKVRDEVCPDHKTYCLSGYTCCLKLDGTYGCCASPNALCCSDRKNCCPAGSVCDLKKNGCVPPTTETEAKLIVESSVEKVQGDSKSMFCPDGSECNDGCTCCMTTSNNYGCCPIYKAVCCPDKVHCCPEGCECSDGDKCISMMHPLLSLNTAPPTIRRLESKDTL